MDPERTCSGSFLLCSNIIGTRQPPCQIPAFLQISRHVTSESRGAMTPAATGPTRADNPATWKSKHAGDSKKPMPSGLEGGLFTKTPSPTFDLRA
jgi:hypothetical protein